MKTTLEIPDAPFRRAKSRAAGRGIPGRQFVTLAVEDRPAPGKPPWMKLTGGLKQPREETARINKISEDEFAQIEPEMWK
jgi:hypothetical protein